MAVKCILVLSKAWAYFGATSVVLKDALSQIVVEDRIHRSFPLYHLDFHQGNLLFGEEYNLTGVLNWIRAQKVPLERPAVSPEFVAGPLCLGEHKESVAEFLTVMRTFLRGLQRGSSCGGSPNSYNQANAMRDGSGEADEEADSDVDNDNPHTIQQTALADIFGTVQAEIANRRTLSNQRVTLWFRRVVPKITFGKHVSWEQMMLAFGKRRFC
ncbi:hypothetical protein SLS63_014199 [Diaporthe eres]|uniref:Aminoglycoside phosphotransferase domain-containing protein n=1 Tax=Diaporthe eres TaxID=83184 RepID=A0ABR1NLG5_DIAER